MDRILLVRHAQAGGHEDADPEFNSTGEMQAQQLATRLSSS